MKMKTKTTIMAALIALGAGTALAQTTYQDHSSMSMGQMDSTAMQKMMDDMMPSPNDPPSTKDYKSADMNMMKGMHAPYTGNPDVDFRTHMIPHHQGAIDIAKVALKYAKDPDTRRMAQTIIDDQDKEIAEMKDWLKKNGKM
jgi:uncharacterized protein (DUF305 family)